MASVHRPTPSYYMDYSSHDAEVLDLSRTRPTEEYIYHNRYQIPAYEDHHLHRHPPSPQSMDEPHPDHERHSRSPQDDNFARSRNEAHLASQMELDRPAYPVCASSPSSTSPTNYPAYYPGTDRINQYVLHAAFHRQIAIEHENKSEKPRQSETDTISDAGSDGSHNSHNSSYPIYANTGKEGKMPRPFKAYPKDPLSLTTGFSSVDVVLDKGSVERYNAFRQSMLEQICAANGGQATISNPKMRRTVNNNNNEVRKCDSRDNSYTERRKKNNAAAKKSRDRRRIKEDEIAIRAAFLERENIELKFELAAVRKQIAAMIAKAAGKS